MNEPPSASPPDPEPLDTLLVEWLAIRPRHCPRCQYDLTGLGRPVCAECGQEIRLRVQGDAGVSAALLAGIIMIGGALGFTTMLGLGSVVYEMSRGRPIRFDEEIQRAAIATVMVGGLLAGWLLGRRWLLRLPPMVAWIGALGLGLVSGTTAFWIIP